MQNRYLLTPYFLDQPSPKLKALAGPDWVINDPTLPKASQLQRLAALYEPIKTFVAGAISQQMRPVSIAGDCCTALGVVAGLRDAGYSPVLIWLDAHGDFNTPETTPSGFLGGMPLAMLVGRGDQTLVKALKLEPLKESQVILSDARDLDPGEKQAVEGSHLHYVRDLAAVLDGIPAAPPLYVHLDVDLIDPTQAPAMSYRAPGGPSAATVKSLLRALMQTERLAAISVSAWNPDLDTDGKTQAICMDVLGPLFNH